ncbi:MAG TPA: hypothetical protein VKS79_10865 [Gemmataceae bacterium]|nr:hypothetical protein [Gemmataceae bacterium]
MPLTISSTYHNTIILNNPTAQNPATVTSTGLISVVNGGGVYGTAGYAWTLSNLGTIAGNGTLHDGVDLTAGGSVTNGQSGSAGGYIKGNYGGILIKGGAGTVKNLGQFPERGGGESTSYPVAA